jgi:hypothetical protein
MFNCWIRSRVNIRQREDLIFNCPHLAVIEIWTKYSETKTILISKYISKYIPLKTEENKSKNENKKN